MANYISLLFTADNFFTFEDNEIVGTVTGMTNGLAASATATLLLSLVSFFCIRYPETQTRWGARTLVSILPFIATLYIVSAALA